MRLRAFVGAWIKGSSRGEAGPLRPCGWREFAPGEVEDFHCIGSRRADGNHVDPQKARASPHEWCDLRQGADEAGELGLGHGSFGGSVAAAGLHLDGDEQAATAGQLPAPPLMSMGRW